MHRLLKLSLLLLCAPAFAAPRTVTLSIPTMDCATCPITIKTALQRVPGVSKVTVSYPRRNAVIVYDDAKTDIAALKHATEEAGYPALLASGQ